MHAARSGSFGFAVAWILACGLGHKASACVEFVRMWRGSGLFGCDAARLPAPASDRTMTSTRGRTCANHGALLSWMVHGKGGRAALEACSVTDDGNLSTRRHLVLPDAAAAGNGSLTKSRLTFSLAGPWDRGSPPPRRAGWPAERGPDAARLGLVRTRELGFVRTRRGSGSFGRHAARLPSARVRSDSEERTTPHLR